MQTEVAALKPREAPALHRLRHDPARLLVDAGVTPDKWQADLLRAPGSQTLLLCSRQAGKSTVAAALALHQALTEPGSLVLLLSPSARQSGELFLKAKGLYEAIGRPVPLSGPRENALRMTLANGARIISLPGAEGTIRGYSGVRLLVIDEAARVDDALYMSVRPMLAVSRGRLLALSTPFGRRGWYYEEYSGARPWQRVRVTAEQCPRIGAEFLAAERAMIGERWFRQEYGCEFMEQIGAVFSGADIDALIAESFGARAFPE